MARRSVKQVLNSTGRRRIAEKDISLSLTGDPPIVRVLRLDLPSADEDNDEYGAADVWIEAAQPRTASFDRWRLGTVKTIQAKGASGPRPLENFSDPADALFIIKVVAADGRLLASSEDIRPDDRRQGEREALLQVRSRPLGELTWAVDIAPDGQTALIVNSKIPAAETWIENDPVASALVLPAAVRGILARLLSDDVFRETEWGRAWSEWAAALSPAEMPAGGEADDRDAWIEPIIEAFASRHFLASRIADAMERETAE